MATLETAGGPLQPLRSLPTTPKPADSCQQPFSLIDSAIPFAQCSSSNLTGPHTTMHVASYGTNANLARITIAMAKDGTTPSIHSRTTPVTTSVSARISHGTVPHASALVYPRTMNCLLARHSIPCPTRQHNRMTAMEKTTSYITTPKNYKKLQKDTISITSIPHQVPLCTIPET